MRYKLKYQTRGKVETYIVMTTSLIAAFQSQLYDYAQLDTILGNIADEVQAQAKASTKGLTATPECEIANNHLSVRNTLGREVLAVWFERIYDKGQAPQCRKL